MNNPIKKLVIFGEGYSPYLAALFVKQKLANFAPDITVVDYGTAEANKRICTLASMRRVHSELRVSEPEFVKQTQAEINLGFDYQNFPSQGKAALFVDSEYGFNLDNRRFPFLFSKYLKSNEGASFEDFCLNSAMARQSKFTPPSPKAESIFSSIDYGYCLDSNAYKTFLHKLATQAGIATEHCSEVKTTINHLGHIETLTIDKDKALSGDLFIDTSSDQALFKSINPITKQKAYSLIVKEEESVYAEENEYLPYSKIEALNGKLKLCSSLNTAKLQTTYSFSRHSGCDKNEDPNYWLEHQPWKHNCIAMGQANIKRPAVLVDNFEVLVYTFRLLLDLWPRTKDMASEATVFNKNCTQTFLSLLELDEFHFALASGINDSMPNRISERQQSFSYNGAILKMENDWLEDFQWAALFCTLGYYPNHVDVSVADYDTHKLTTDLNNIRTTIGKAVSAAPDYATFIRKVHK